MMEGGGKRVWMCFFLFLPFFCVFNVLDTHILKAMEEYPKTEVRLAAKVTRD